MKIIRLPYSLNLVEEKMKGDTKVIECLNKALKDELKAISQDFLI